MAVVFRCDHCGMGLQAGDKQRNTVVSCPKCKSAILVPSSVNDLPRSGADSHNSDDGTSSSILAVVLIAVAAPVVIVLLLLLIYRPLVFAISCLALLALVAVGVLHVLWAKSQAFGKHRHDVPLFFGLVRLVVWEPTEGVVLLKNKQITYVEPCIPRSRHLSRVPQGTLASCRSWKPLGRGRIGGDLVQRPFFCAHRDAIDEDAPSSSPKGFFRQRILRDGSPGKPVKRGANGLHDRMSTLS
jgi:DNA-directed RNA polymerase subunit RPC12/RpoP